MKTISILFLIFATPTTSGENLYLKNPSMNLSGSRGLDGFCFMEEFRDVKGYEGLYQVSNLGRVKRLSRVDNLGRNMKEIIMKSRINKGGYPRTCLTIKGKDRGVFNHTLVVEAFIGLVPSKMVVDHIDNNQSNNRLDNLQIITHRENCSKDKKGFTGVTFHEGKFRALIQINGKTLRLGRFTKELDAHYAYQEKLKEITNE